MKKTVIVLGFVLVNGLFIHSTVDSKRDSLYVDYPKNMDFAGEIVPYRVFDVQERLDREMITNINYHTNTTLVIKRANRVFPIIEPILKKNGIPDDFKYLAVIESSLVNAVSPAGARGVWQFMPGTAREHGLEVNDYVDERYHLAKSTEAACQYLRKSYEKFNSWTLAAAAYNAGSSGIAKKLNEQQVENFYDLLLIEETSRYVFRILALKELMTNPVKYGFNIPKEALYQPIPVRTVEVNETINDFVAFAKEQGTNYKAFKLHNQWLRSDKLINKTGATYQFEIPTTGY